MVHYIGDAGNNSHPGTMFKDTLEGLGGSDTLSGGGNNDSILGGDQNDFLSGGIGKDTVYGGLDNDNVDAGFDQDRDHLFGEDGNDFVFGRAKDVLDGGGGTDYLGLNLSDYLGLNLDLSALTSGGSLSFLGGTVSGFETGVITFTDGDDKVRAPAASLLIQGAVGSDTLLGGAANDQFDGGVGLTGDADIMKGGDGADSLNGGVGDLLDGGPGFDFYFLYLGNVASPFTVNFTPLYTGGTVFVGMGTKLVRLEDGSVVFGSGNDDIKTGAPAGGSGVRVDGGDGNDTLVGGDGHDNIVGGAGNDVIRGGLDDDTANYQYESDAVTIDLNVTGFQDTGGAGIDKIVECEWVNGSQGGDRITGNAADNKFEGYGGADTLIGGQGDDTLNGGTSQFDALVDVDRLSGGAGQDTYRGGIGDDVLVWSSTFHTTVAAPDQIFGLEAGDVIHLKDIDANTTVAGDQAFTMVGALTGVAGQLAVVFGSGKTQWLMDTDGDGAADGLIEALGDHTGHAEYVL